MGRIDDGDGVHAAPAAADPGGPNCPLGNSVGKLYKNKKDSNFSKGAIISGFVYSFPYVIGPYFPYLLFGYPLLPPIPMQT